MWRGASGYQPRGGGAGPEFSDPLDERRRDRRMVGEAEVVVRGEVPELAAIYGNSRTCGREGGDAPEKFPLREIVELLAWSHSAVGRSRDQRSSFSESDQMFGVLDFRTTQTTERPLRLPVEIRQRPEALVVPVFMPST